MGTLPTAPSLAQRFAAGIALAGLMLTFVGASLLVFPYKVTASPASQADLLYDLLGHLDYTQDRGFHAVDDAAMQGVLLRMIEKNNLDGREGSAYIIDLGSGKVLWSASGFPLDFELSDLSSGYEIQYHHNGGYHLTVQNFWQRVGLQRQELRMVVALLAE